MKYIIIGLGNYGYVLAEELAGLGHEVIGADIREDRIESIKDKIATAIVVDATDDAALSVLPLKEVDKVIVAIGEDLGSSVRVVALLKLKKVEHIYARAIDSIHKAILEAFYLEKILTPEEDAARDLVQVLNFGVQIDTFQIDPHHYVLKFKVPEKFIGSSLDDLKLETFNIRFITWTRPVHTTNSIGLARIEQKVIDDTNQYATIQADDELVCYGNDKDFRALLKA